MIAIDSFNLDWSVMLEDVKELQLKIEPKNDVYEKSIANMFHQYGGLMKTAVEIDNTLGTDIFIERVRQLKMSEKKSIE